MHCLPAAPAAGVLQWRRVHCCCCCCWCESCPAGIAAALAQAAWSCRGSLLSAVLQRCQGALALLAKVRTCTCRDDSSNSRHKHRQGSNSSSGSGCVWWSMQRSSSQQLHLQQNTFTTHNAVEMLARKLTACRATGWAGECTLHATGPTAPCGSTFKGLLKVSALVSPTCLPAAQLLAVALPAAAAAVEALLLTEVSPAAAAAVAALAGPPAWLLRLGPGPPAGTAVRMCKGTPVF
jgi:hypothetical protein